MAPATEAAFYDGPGHLFRRTKCAIYFAHPQFDLVGQFMEPESGLRIGGLIRQATAFDDLVLDSDQVIQKRSCVVLPLEQDNAQHSGRVVQARSFTIGSSAAVGGLSADFSAGSSQLMHWRSVRPERVTIATISFPHFGQRVVRSMTILPIFPSYGSLVR